MIFAHLRTSTNYNKEEKKITSTPKKVHKSATKKAKAKAAATEAKRLRKEQQAAEKLEKEILETAQSVALQNNLNVNPTSPVIAHLVKIMTVAGRASFSDAENALSNIENTYQFGEGTVSYTHLTLPTNREV